MGLNNYSSGYSTESTTPWSMESWSGFRTPLQSSLMPGSSQSTVFTDHAGRSTRNIDAVMEEFKMNGSDSPYDPEEDSKLNSYSGALIGMGPSGIYLRQKSWPAPEATPTVPLPPLGLPDDYRRQSGKPILSVERASEVGIEPLPLISRQQLEVLNSLPNSVLYFLLKELEQKRSMEATERQSERIECRFCKSNGEPESQYRSHRLRWQGRVACPVLRAYRCRRCGADGDDAHTLKYCPLTTADERKDLAARMRSVHSRRRSFQKTIDNGEDMAYRTTNTPTNGHIYQQEPLLPIWEALANKLML